MDEEDYFPEPIQLLIDGSLDLHLFRPSEIKDLLHDYIAECHALGIFELRIIHGKGKGVLRRLVHTELTRISLVRNFRLAGEEAGSWGTTLVSLHRLPPEA